ncbi:hypothetical protein SDC9_127998 [bioreactor metagenome]|uniref:Uncharacterized protein n=1 Tax=bioreactor metagenome TaxID=1076179 RepID=A0A645CVK7_9ZZZZ
MLYGLRGYGAHRNFKYAGHIELFALARKQVFILAALARHFIKQRNALCFRRNQIVILRRALEKLSRAVFCKLDIAEYNERADIQLIRDLAQRQLAFHAGYIYRVLHLHLPPESNSTNGPTRC